MSSLVLNQDGRPELFVIGSDKALWHQWTDYTGTWGQWSSLGGTDLRQISVATNKDGRIEVFALGGDRSLYNIRQTTPNGNWSGWSSLGGTDLQHISAVVNQDGRIEVFALGGDHSLYNIWQTTPNGSWSSWEHRGGTELQQISVTTNRDGRIEVFALGGDHSLYNIWQTTPNGSWSSWEHRGGTVKRIKASRQPNGTLQVIALGFDDKSYRIAQNSPGGSWGNWQLLLLSDALDPFNDSINMSFSLLGGIGSELISSVATAQQPPSAGNARGKSTKELAMQCIVELATVTVATSGLVAAVQKRNIPEIIGRVTLLTTGLATASNMCDEAISQGFEQLSEHFDSPEKSGIHNIEELRYIDYTPDPDPKIKVA